LLLGLCLFLFFWNLGEIPFYTKGEPREGMVVTEIYKNGNWILPLRNKDQIPSKPPLFHWLGTGVSKSVGRVDEFTIRFPSALLGTLGIGLTYLAGACLWGPGAGLVAGLVLATNVEWWRAAVTARVDMTLTFFMLCAFLFFDVTYRRERGGVTAAAFLGLLLALAVLAKGPLGVVVPCATFFAYLLFERNLGFLRKLNPVVVVGSVILIAGSWYGLAYWQEGERFFLKQIVQENLTAAVGSRGHEQPFYYFIPNLFLYLAPWSLFFPALAVFLYSRRRSLTQDRLLYPLVWFGTVLFLFSMAPAKRSVYILSLYPAVALLFGAWWRTLRAEPPHALKLVRLGVYLNGAVFFLSAALWIAQLSGVDFMGIARSFMRLKNQGEFPFYVETVAQNRTAILIWAVLTVAGSLGLILAMKRRAWEVLAVSLAGLMGVSLFLVQNRFHPALAGHHSFRPFMARVRTAVAENDPLFFYRTVDYGAVFYAQRPILIYGEGAGAGGSPFFLLMWEVDWSKLGPRKGLNLLDVSEVTNPDQRSKLVLLKVTDEAQLQAGPLIPSYSEFPGRDGNVSRISIGWVAR